MRKTSVIMMPWHHKHSGCFHNEYTYNIYIYNINLEKMSNKHTTQRYNYKQWWLGGEEWWVLMINSYIIIIPNRLIPNE